MNILFFLYQFCYPPSTGTATRSYNFIRKLSRHHNIYLLSLSLDEVPQAHIDKMKKFCRNVQVLPLVKKRSYRDFARSLFSEKPYKFYQYQNRAFDQAVSDQVSRFRIDLLVLDYVFMASPAIGGMKVKKCLLSPNLEYVLMKKYAEHGSLVRRFYGMTQWKKLMLHELDRYRCFDKVVFVSRHDEELVKKQAPSVSSDVVEGIIDTDYFTAKRAGSSSSLDLIYVGTMWYYPNVHAMIWFVREVLPLVRKEAPGATLTIVGEKPVKEVLALARAEGVRVTGRVPDVRPYMDKSAAYVAPLFIGSGIRSKILEALAMQIPVVSTRFAAEGLEVTDDENILLADTPEGFVSSLVRLSKDAVLREKLSRNGRDLVVKKYGWDVLSDKLDRIISKI
jgi:polysaccharide biosynthesis protein PslH